MKYLFSSLMMVSAMVNAQVAINFEDSDITNWEMNAPGRWDASPDNPHSGLYSLKHVFDNPESGEDRISLRFDELHLDKDTTTWAFSVLYEYNPSSSNNWSAFLLADNNASDMYPGGNINAYVVGVNLTGNDDCIKMWKINDGNEEIIYNTGYDWQVNVGTDTIANIIVKRFPDGMWQLHLEKNMNQLSLGEFYENSLISGNYFGFYYDYTSSGDQQLTFDELSIDGRFIPDTVVPDFDTIAIIDTCTIKIRFYEPIHADSLGQLSNYVLTTKGIPDSLSITGSDEVVLKYNTAFDNEAEYEVTVKNMVDLNGNVSTSLTDTFLYYQAVKHDIIVTEIQSDPLPVVDLPEYEYIEILNNSAYPIDISGWKLQTSRVEKQLNPFVMQPQQRLLLCHEDALELLNQYGTCSDVLTSLSTLLNTRDTIILRDQYSQVVDSMHYTKEWHVDTKNDGGWSLELTNIERKCMHDANWMSSTDQAGGTPGTTNSVFLSEPDVRGPAIDTVVRKSDTLFHIFFSEPVDTASLSVAVKQTHLLTSTLEPVSKSKANVYVHETFNEGNYSVSVFNLTDRCYNTTLSDSVILYHHQPQQHEIIINEFLVDPVPGIDLPEYEFIELLNLSEFDINLHNWLIRSNDTEYPLTDFIIKSGEAVILTHESAYDFYAAFGQVLPVINNTYFLSNAGAGIALVSHHQQVIDSVYYYPEFYEQSLDGTSLERMHNHLTCNHPRYLQPSLNSMGGTPGKYNSQTEAPTPSEIVLQEASFLNDSVISLQFSDMLDTASTAHITYNNEQQLTNHHFINSTVLRLKLNIPVSSGDTANLKISGLVSYCGQLVDDHESTLVFYAPKQADVLISEIMADPLPVVDLPEYEYIEIKNNTPYDIDVTDWTLHTTSAEKTFDSYIMPADSRLILCHEDAEKSLSQYGNCMSLFTSLSTLRNRQDSIIIYDQHGNIIDSIYYADALHDKTKNNGGYSLELTNDARQCSKKYNWRSSGADIGGTPGQPNLCRINEPDTEAPVIAFAKRSSDSIFTIGFSEPLLISTMVIDCWQDHTINTSVNVIQDSLIEIHALDKLNEGDIHLSFNNVTDQCFNTTASDSVMFYHHHPQKHEIIINEFMPDPTPVKGLPENEFIELFNASAFDINLGGWHVVTDAGAYELPNVDLEANQHVTLTHKKAMDGYSSFGQVLPVLGNKYFLPNSQSSIALYSGNDSLIDSLHYNMDFYEQAMDGTSLERMHRDFNCFHPANLMPSKNNMGATPGKLNSMVVRTEDIELPAVASAQINEDGQIIIEFDNYIDSIKSIACATSSNFQFQYKRFESHKKLVLQLDEQISSGDTLFLEITGLYDLCGRELNKLDFSFTTYMPAEFDVLITEIMADPEPVVSLPQAEYIELYNASSYSIDSKTLRLSINGKETSLSPFYFKPGSYYIIADDDDTTNFADYKNVHSIPSLHLLNGQNDIQLVNTDDELIHFVFHADDLFTSDIKREGGWSLEMKDLDNPCKIEGQWKASESYTGGTPGHPNTATDDERTSIPMINGVGIPADSVIRMHLNEYVPLTQLDALGIETSPELVVDTVAFRIQSFSLDIELSIPLEQSKQYTIQLKNIIGCSEIVSDSRIFDFGLPSVPSEGDVLISEIMFDPDDTKTEYIEIYNASEKIMDLSNLYLQTGSTEDPSQMCTESFLFFPGDYLLICKNKERCTFNYSISKGNVIEMKSFASLNNDQDYINISSVNNLVIDECIYSNDMHHHMLDDTKGVALERISFEIRADQSSNWTSAASMAEFCTPGSENSQHLANVEEVLNKQLKVDPEIFSPNNDGHNDLLRISYHLPKDEYTLNASVYDASGRLITHIARNEVISSTGTLFWNGMDADQKPAHMGIYVIYFEAVGVNGNVVQRKETCVLAKQTL